MIEDKMQLTEWLDELCVRFIINLPVEELSSVARICFQIEEAQWFYEDFVRPLDPDFPSLNLRTFSTIMFQHCPLLKGYTPDDQDRAFKAFMEYKTMVPVRGAIMLNDSMDEVVLVKGWKKGATWSFPRGKIDQNELDLTCAIREVYEETGYDLKEAGLVEDEENMKSINVQIRGQDLKMYVFRGVPQETEFLPRTRKEISKVQWHRLSDLPTVKAKNKQRDGQTEDLAGNANKFYMVAPFLGPLKKWIAQQKKRQKVLHPSRSKGNVQASISEAENVISDFEVVDDAGKDGPAGTQHLDRLLQSLRQSSQAEVSDLPEVSVPSMLEEAPHTKKEADSAGLKALLFGHQQTQTNAPPMPAKQVPAEHQQIRPFQHDQDSSVPTLERPLPPTVASQPKTIESTAFLPHPQEPQFQFQRPVHAQAQLPQDIPRSIVPTHGNPALAPSASLKEDIFPPPNVVQDHKTSRASVDIRQPFIAPPASNLPLPSLNSQKKALLNLFKPSQAEVTPIVKATAPTMSPKTPVSGASDGSKAHQMFVPPQVSRLPSEKANREVNTQQAKLLSLFHGSSTKAEPKALGAQEPMIELSASPLGIRSHNNSTAPDRNQSVQSPNKNAGPGQTKIKRRPPHGSASPSATVTGPLDSPHFGMVRSLSQERSDEPQYNDAVKVSPIRILSRPDSSGARGSAPQNILKARPGPHSKERSDPSDILDRPATPNLQAKDAVPQPFQLQILRRPDISQAIAEPSPIQALPSPQHKVVRSKDASLQNDQKKSLLSLFTSTAPSPIVSPPSAAPGNSGVVSSIVSPLEKPDSVHPVSKGATSRDKADIGSINDVLKATSVAQDESKQRKKYYAPDRMPPSLETRQSNVPGGSENDPNEAKRDSIASPASTITPANQAYLLKFLNGLK